MSIFLNKKRLSIRVEGVTEKMAVLKVSGDWLAGGVNDHEVMNKMMDMTLIDCNQYILWV